MTIKYALKRAEIAKSFFLSLQNSSRFLITICLYSLAMGFVELLATGSFSRPLTAKDIGIAITTSAAFFVFMPGFLFLRGKTSLRTLSISPYGITTEIGKMKADVAWSKIKIVSEAGEGVLVASTSGNAFFIPKRAFTSPDQRTLFIAQSKEWMLARP